MPSLSPRCLSPHLLLLCLSLSLARPCSRVSISHLLFFPAAVTAATLRLICADGPEHTGCRSLARNPVEWKLNQSLFVMSARPRLPFYPPRILRRISAPSASAGTSDSTLTVSTAVCLYQRHSKSFRAPLCSNTSPSGCIVNYVPELRALIISRYIFAHYICTPRVHSF